MKQPFLILPLAAVVVLLPTGTFSKDTGGRGVLELFAIRDAGGSEARELARTHSGFCRMVESRCADLPTIHVGPHAAGHALDRLAEFFALVPLPADPRDQVLGPIVVGGADLNDAAIARQLSRAYEAGHTVAVVEATARHAAQLRSHVGASGGCAVAEGAVALMGLQQSTPGRPAIVSEYILHFREPSFDVVPRRPGWRFDQQSPLADIEFAWLHDRFQATAPAAPLAGDMCTDPTSCLTQLATGYNCSVLAALTDPDQTIEIENFTWAARDFDSQEDLYYVLNDFLVTASTGNFHNSPFTMTTTSSPEIAGLPAGTIALIDPSPGESTQTVTTYTSGISEMFGGDVGTSTGISGGVTIENSTSHSVPSTVLTYTADLAKASVDYSSHVTPPGQNVTWITVTTTNQWIWSVPRSAYPANATTFPATSTGKLANFGSSWTTTLQNDVPVPFDTWTLDAPVVTSVTPSSVPVGTEFTIGGSGFYPGTVKGVALNGTFLPAANWIANDENEISVVAPSFGFPTGTALPVVVQTEQGDSSGSETVTLEAAAGGGS